MGSVDVFVLDRILAERLEEDDRDHGAAADVPPAAVAGGVGPPMPDPTSLPWAPGHDPGELGG